MPAAYLVVAFYKFAALSENALHDLQTQLNSICLQHRILGTILLAEEGINGTVASTASGIKTLVSFFRSNARFESMEYKYSEAETMPFNKTKINIKKEIVTFGVDNINPNQRTGKYISPEEWNDLIASDEVLVIDTRNDFEVEMGTFQGAINPKTQKFSEFPQFVENKMLTNKQQKIAMFCTGGIRCEKASAYLLEQGFENVYQLEGGILKYLEKIPTDKSLWQGDCFIFDHRRVLKKESISSV